MTELAQEYGKSFTCPNKSCKKTFPNPLRTLNLRVSSDVYDACPYCLSKMLLPKPDCIKSVSGLKIVPSKLATCHHLFSLADRAEKGVVPDECLFCKDIISCMNTTFSTK